METRYQNVDVSGAQCKLRNDKGTWFVTTPGSVAVHRSYQDMVVECTKTGLPTGWASVKSSTKGMAFSNILLGGVIGAAYDYPQVIVVDMGATRTITSAPAKTNTANPLEEKTGPATPIAR